ncbi:HupE/UreJ family protein [Leisingera sp. M523]|uniref:HupE/UreJ family protein n=1 Tax=Leisingera sp. M523 TaxID=2867013 RepID=UPI0021A37103|nr:HupE/UreJ family protein [Leisingera sp. M523]UWQ27214.1 HupE/UreJ family protein [Leisingera sp. M523]
MGEFDMTEPRSSGIVPFRKSLFIALLSLAVLFCDPQGARAHFSNADPRIIHIAAQGNDRAIILIRMPAPLALLPDDWQGRDEVRLPPFAAEMNGEPVLDTAAIAKSDEAVKLRLREVVTLWVSGQRQETRVEKFRFWEDSARPSFGTLKSALSAYEAPFSKDRETPLPYFDLTLDVMISAPSGILAQEIRLDSQLGWNFRVMESLGTVTKLHRETGIETRATMGVLQVSFPALPTTTKILLDTAKSGAEHIYRGPDHLALITLIAIAAQHWRQALSWASAFTVGHMTTLVAGLYGFAPSASWFVPVVETAIILSIIYACAAVFLRQGRAFGWASLLIVGLFHGYGFAASASEALFTGQFDPLVLISFAIGLELCQFAIYAMALPLIVIADRIPPKFRISWRKAVVLGIMVFAISAAISRLSDTASAFAVA